MTFRIAAVGALISLTTLAGCSMPRGGIAYQQADVGRQWQTVPYWPLFERNEGEALRLYEPRTRGSVGLGKGRLYLVVLDQEGTVAAKTEIEGDEKIRVRMIASGACFAQMMPLARKARALQTWTVSETFPDSPPKELTGPLPAAGDRLACGADAPQAFDMLMEVKGWPFTGPMVARQSAARAWIDGEQVDWSELMSRAKAGTLTGLVEVAAVVSQTGEGR